MVTSFAPRTTEMMNVTELLELFDTMTGYGLDTYSREELEKVDPQNPHKHVTDAKTAQRLIDDYILSQHTRLKGHAPKTDNQRENIVRSDGFLQNATYNREDILDMLRDKTIQKLLETEFHKRTLVVQGVFIPTIVADNHPIDPANQDDEKEEWYL